MVGFREEFYILGKPCTYIMHHINALKMQRQRNAAEMAEYAIYDLNKIK